jgi:1-acyl-sn-glycerol-3-phosphate acyltransferase
MEYPELGPLIPRRGNRFTSSVARSILRYCGWSFDGDVPNLQKGVVIVAPHTSNWDFFLGVTAMFALGVRFSWLGKCIVFRQPLGTLMRWLGGIPVNRAAPTGVVDQVVHSMNEADAMLLGLSPEGTRSTTKRWRSGFWRIARGAKVPIIPVYFDYRTRIIGFTSTFEAGDDLEHDLEILQERYRNITPCHPVNLSES